MKKNKDLFYDALRAIAGVAVILLGIWPYCLVGFNVYSAIAFNLGTLQLIEGIAGIVLEVGKQNETIVMSVQYFIKVIEDFVFYIQVCDLLLLLDLLTAVCVIVIYSVSNFYMKFVFPVTQVIGIIILVVMIVQIIVLYKKYKEEIKNNEK